jgi:prevent-host-death family protein
MEVIPELMPISELRLRQNEVLSKLPEGAVVLTQHGRAVAVLVSPQQWNNLIEELEDLEDVLEAAEIKRRIETGEEAVTEWSEIEAELDDIPDQGRGDSQERVTTAVH